MKRMKTKDIFVASFHELSVQKPVDQITVGEICTNCDYSTATFYRHFTDKYDLIAYDYTSHIASFMQKISKEYSWQEAVEEAVEYLASQKAYLKNLFKHTKGQDSFSFYMSTINIHYLTEVILKAMNKTELTLPLDLAVKTYGYGCTKVICDWVLGQVSCSDDVLLKSLIMALPNVLTPYLLEE